MAAIGIIYNAIDYLITPRPITAATVGINQLSHYRHQLCLPKWLMVAAKKHDSIALEVIHTT
jgi:hypothetical protein